MLQEGVPYGGQSYASSFTLEEPRSNGAFEPPDAFAKRWLAKVQLFGCEAQMPEFGDYLKVAQVSRVDVHLIALGN
ncbi:hypothetical protein ANI02nite_03860 [Acetobacter nitrogenifigens DSM 23921 = NBRC 105050]|uniref:Uncharacterized protein n=1 Tax=Acetobacter nitrogenifigens DSM 23921 = NBRC 105050 TaxID=1120919 RepID=A0A511X6D9_9PROT|nr:hypothetical protein ANI02nite_03860 [Acetobacter nitrogenifigens DSM 23921 = NBRC 105050]